MANPVRLEFEGGDKMRRILKQMRLRMNNASEVKVGFLADAQYPRAYTHRVQYRISPNRTELSIPQVAFWNEFGNQRIPPRPFFRTMIAEKSPRWGDSMAYLARAHNYDARMVLSNMGRGIQGQLTESIKNWTTPGNAALTVRIKGFNKPLTDEGKMANAVAYEVK